MNRKVFSVFALGLMVVGSAAMASGQTRRKARVPAAAAVTTPKAPASSALIALLPASDGVAAFDVKRGMNDALPRLFGANQKILTEINKAITDVQTRVGVDMRKFDHVVAGLAFRQTENGKIDLDPVLIARGDINAASLISLAKQAANTGVREEQVAGKTVFIFTPKSVPGKGSAVGSKIDGLDGEMAATAFDANTLVFGTVDRVRQTLYRQTTVATDITSLLARRETSVMSFALRTPSGLKSFLPLDNDEIGENLDSIRYLSGVMDVTPSGAMVGMMARTQEPAKAQRLSEMLIGLKMLGRTFLGGSKRPDQQVFLRLINGTQVTQAGNDVNVDITISQADIDSLVATIK